MEAALVLPLALLLLLGIIEMGRIAWTQSALNFAVEEAARCAVIRPDLCGSQAQVGAYAAGKAAPLVILASDFVLTRSVANCGTRVSVAAPYSFMAWALLPAKPTIQAQACHA